MSMIRKLNDKEIEEIEDKIYTELIKNEKNKGYFCDGERDKPIEAYMIDDYYLDFTKYENLVFLGLIKVGTEKIKTSNCIALFKIIDQKLNEYGELGAWCYLDNSISLRFHELLKKKYKHTHIKQEGISFIKIKEDKDA